jgi:hypothetical protein
VESSEISVNYDSPHFVKACDDETSAKRAFTIVVSSNSRHHHPIRRYVRELTGEQRFPALLSVLDVIRAHRFVSATAAAVHERWTVEMSVGADLTIKFVPR